MERINATQSGQWMDQTRCTVCGAPMQGFDACCERDALGGLTPEQYVDLFWDEA
jgi:hypothetical protein